MKASSYTQRDGKTVAIDAKGRANRFLPSGARDPEPLAGLERIDQRVRKELGQKLTSTVPLSVSDIAFAHPMLESVEAFNQARADWQRATFVLRKALGRTYIGMTEMALEAVGGEHLEPEDFVDKTEATPRLRTLVAAVNEAAERLGRSIDNVAGAAR